MTHTTTDAAEVRALPVTQADRDAAGSLVPLCFGASAIWQSNVRAGYYDDGEIVQAFARHRLATAEAASGAGERHPDDMAVDLFTAQMKAKLAASRAKGRGGWDDPARCSTEYLRHLLHEHVAKGDPIDVANFCMMLAHYGASTAALPPAMVDTGELVEMLSAATLEEGATVFEHSAEEIGLEVMEHHKAVLAALAAAPTIPATGEAIRAVTAEMRRFMPTACGDWADKIDDALAEEKGRKVAFYDEGGIDIRPGESLADRDRRIYQQGRHDALNDEPEAFI